MSFSKIKDPVKREQTVKEYLATMKRIRDNQLAERTGDIELQTDLSKFFKPILETQKAATKEITEGLKPIKEGIEQLPKEFPQQQFPFSSPPSYRSQLSIPESLGTEFGAERPTLLDLKYLEKEKDFDETFGIYEEGGKKYTGNKQIDYGSTNNYFIIGDKEYDATKGLWELITSKNPKSENYSAKDYANYAEILAQTSALHRGNNPADPYPKANRGDKWRFVKPIWKRTTIATGKGITIIPSNPNALLERLDLLMASKKAGNTGVRNELVSICDELKRQRVLNTKTYKKLMSIL